MCANGPWADGWCGHHAQLLQPTSGPTFEPARHHIACPAPVESR